MKNTMKKIGALLILSIFMVGLVPSAFAFEANKWDAQAHAKWQTASNQITASRNNFKQVSSELSKFLSDVRKRNTLTLDDAEEVKSELISALDKLSKELTTLDSKTKSTCLSEESSSTYLKEVQSNIAKLRSDIDAWEATSTSPRKDLNGFLSRMRNFYKEDFSGVFYQAVSRAGACKAQWVLGQVDKMINKAHELQDKVAPGVDLTASNALIADMEAKQATLESDYDSLVAQWGNVKNYKDAADSMKNVNNYIKNAAPIARSIYSQVKTTYIELKK